jgi:uncharacterized membrane protein
MVLFTDAVFAIVMTLMAIEIRLPSHPAGGWTHDTLSHALAELGPRFLAYAVSFLVAALLWTGHLRKYRHLRAIDTRLLWLNLLHLLFVGLLPFFTAALSETGQGLAVLLYASNLALAGLMALLAWRHASGSPALAAASLTALVRREESLVTLTVVVVFAVSAALAFWQPLWAMWSWMIVFPAIRLARRSARRHATRL